jgi:hypothetical protein
MNADKWVFFKIFSGDTCLAVTYIPCSMFGPTMVYLDCMVMVKLT